ncbi:hypothetical protein HPB51_028825 [Rhipicephalus microplus]|uniref:Uncharacterized protein n=1 Tax=Rhipicephalus microplus TaxID=6941 RepID=A0A9J6CVV0_RHIMP|nr:hypothetical protein HPB51_028825 [Rhipicephalus microplus]
MGDPLIGATVLWMAYRFSTLPEKLTIYAFLRTVTSTLFIGPLGGQRALGHALAMVMIALAQGPSLSPSWHHNDALDLTRAFPTINLKHALQEQFVRLGTLFLVQVLNTTTLPKLMSMLGLLALTDVERANMNMVIITLRNTASSSTNFQRRDKKFSGADWKWVQMHTCIENPYEDVDEDDHAEQTDTYLPALAYRNATARKASCSILRLQKVCCNKQCEDGMIHSKTKSKILAALQYAMEKEVCLDYTMMKPFVTVPGWIYGLKDLVQ